MSKKITTIFAVRLSHQLRLITAQISLFLMTSITSIFHLSTPSLAASSSCVAVFSTNSNGKIGVLNTIDHTYVNIYDYSNTSTNINAIAVQPGTGKIFFVDRTNNQLVIYDPNSTNNPSAIYNLPSSSDTIIGATFKNTGEFYLLYSANTPFLRQINPSSGALIGCDMSISGLPSDVNGDIGTAPNGQLYVIADPANNPKLYQLTINSNSANVDNGVSISGLSGAANGLAINPVTGDFFVSTGNGTYRLNTGTFPYSVAKSSSNPATDLAACTTPTPDPPTISKQFSPKNINTTGKSRLTLTLGNSNLVAIYLNKVFTDTFPTGLTIANPNNLGGTCQSLSGNTITATAGNNSVSLNLGATIPVGGCTIAVDVKSSRTGNLINTIASGAVSTVSGTNATAATDTLTVTAPANVLLVKRITAINGNRTKNPNDNTALNTVVDNPATTNDNNIKWPSNFLIGAYNAGKIKPGDEIEYTVYFMNMGGATAANVKVCDRIVGLQTFVNDAYGTSQDFEYKLGTNTTRYLTKLLDPTRDRARFDSSTGTISGCPNPTISGTNNGTVVIDITGSGSTIQDNLTSLPGAIAQGTPSNSYGYFRFKTKINP